MSAGEQEEEFADASRSITQTKCHEVTQPDERARMKCAIGVGFCSPWRRWSDLPDTEPPLRSQLQPEATETRNTNPCRKAKIQCLVLKSSSWVVLREGATDMFLRRQLSEGVMIRGI